MPSELTNLIPNIHASLCNCNDLANCLKFYRRYRNKNLNIYHSLSYAKRQSSVSYFIKYGSSYGSIVTFFSCNKKAYAVIQRYSMKNLFSEYITSSPYHNILSKSMDSFFVVLNDVSTEFDIIGVQNVMDMCIVIEQKGSLVVTPLSAVYEHD
jgi:hypothetical protein